MLIVHISDLHVRDNENHPLSILGQIREDFVDDAKAILEDVGQPDALIISGDIAFSGKESEYEIAHDMLQQATRVLGLSPNQVFLVPGNHDVDRTVAEKQEIRQLHESIRGENIHAASSIIEKHMKKLLAPMATYTKFSAPYDSQVMEKHGYWESYLDAADPPTLLHGIATTLVSDRFDKQGTAPEDLMTVHPGQLRPMERKDSNCFQVLIGHHPPDWWKDDGDLKGRADNYYHLQLYGHQHQFNPEVTESTLRLHAGALTASAAEHGESPPMYNIINVSRTETGTFRVSVWTRVWDTTSGAFREHPEWGNGKSVTLTKTLAVTAATQKASKSMKSKPPQHPLESKVMPDAKTTPDPNLVRFYLLRSESRVYRAIFAEMGFKPTTEQLDYLWGRPYYSGAFAEIVRDKRLGELLQLMERAGIYVK